MIILPHYNGPHTSGNGGYTCGLLDAETDYVSEITLRKPIPLGVDMTLMREDELLSLFNGDELIATVKEGQLNDLVAPPPPDYASAERARQNYLGLKEKLAFPTCYVCGTDRPVDEGLHIYTGKLAGTDTFAATWTPSEKHSDESGMVLPRFIWAALDCPGAYAAMGDHKLTIVLGRMTAKITRPLKIGDRCIIHAWPIGSDGRKHFSGTAIYTEKQELVGIAKATWFEI